MPRSTATRKTAAKAAPSVTPIPATVAPPERSAVAASLSWSIETPTASPLTAVSPADVEEVKRARQTQLDSPAGSWLVLRAPDTVGEAAAAVVLADRWTALARAARSIGLVPRQKHVEDARVIKFRFNEPNGK